MVVLGFVGVIATGVSSVVYASNRKANDGWVKQNVFGISDNSANQLTDEELKDLVESGEIDIQDLVDDYNSMQTNSEDMIHISGNEASDDNVLSDEVVEVHDTDDAGIPGVMTVTENPEDDEFL